MDVDRFFSDAEREAVAAAVREAEARTAGEIVPYVVPASDGYEGTPWRGAALGAFLGPLAAFAAYRLGGFWGGHLPFWMLLPPFAGGATGYLLAAFVPPLKRRLAGAALLELRTRRRAAVAFLEQEVFRTRGRTGILLFLSLFERRVVVLADSGIHAKVEPGAWDGVVAGIVAGIRSGRPGAALAAGIRECGAILDRHGVAARAGDADELSDELRRGDA
jgi:putative membrane protein